ncbi:glycoside hydrolase family 1 protein [Candidatus Dependentiae bacterium]|nr:glycoside hydrolase family 1 protein [Candidatus Dependentiae bacterium]
MTRCKTLLLAVQCLVLSIATVPVCLSAETELKRSVQESHMNELYFPPSFLFGFATSEHQNSGGTSSNWVSWENSTWPDGKPHIDRGEVSGEACDHWNRYAEDITAMKEDFGVNTFRFSLAWDRIEPEEGVFSAEALQHYHDEIDALLKAGITPMVTLHHFVHPQWFEDKGAFEHEENILNFVKFSIKVFEEFGHKVRLWCTINEPTIYMFSGYLPFHCNFPPGKGSLTSWPLAAKVLRNMCQAHTEVYRALKGMKHGDTAQIGLVHQYLKFEGYTGYNPLESMPGFLLNEIMNTAVLTFLKTGTFSYRTHLWYWETYTAPTGPIGDFIGLNYYSRALIELKWTQLELTGSALPGEEMTDMPYAIYAQGLYDAIVEVSQLELPIYITENGIADKETVNDVRRVRWFREYLKATSLALEDGYDVRGFFCWTLQDNFEWNCGYSMKFGLYHVDYTTQKRTLKAGSYIYADAVKAALAGKLATHTRDYRGI